MSSYCNMFNSVIPAALRLSPGLEGWLGALGDSLWIVAQGLYFSFKKYTTVLILPPFQAPAFGPGSQEEDHLRF